MGRVGSSSSMSIGWDGCGSAVTVLKKSAARWITGMAELEGCMADGDGDRRMEMGNMSICCEF
jgi:hypothetical protein